MALDASAQRASRHGAVTTDELALDFDHALRVFRATGDYSGAGVDDELTRLNDLLSAAPEDPLWAEDALDRHPVWEEARALARKALSVLPE